VGRPRGRPLPRGDGADLVDRAGRHIQARGEGLVVLRLRAIRGRADSGRPFNAWSGADVVHQATRGSAINLAFSESMLALVASGASNTRTTDACEVSYRPRCRPQADHRYHSGHHQQQRHRTEGGAVMRSPAPAARPDGRRGGSCLQAAHVDRRHRVSSPRTLRLRLAVARLLP